MSYIVIVLVLISVSIWSITINKAYFLYRKKHALGKRSVYYAWILIAIIFPLALLLAATDYSDETKFLSYLFSVIWLFVAMGSASYMLFHEKNKPHAITGNRVNPRKVKTN